MHYDVYTLFNVDDIFINYEYQYLQIIDINIYKCQNIYFIDLHLHFKWCVQKIYIDGMHVYYPFYYKIVVNKK